MKKLLLILIAVLFFSCNDFKDKSMRDLFLCESQYEVTKLLKENLTEDELKLYKQNGKLIAKNEGIVKLIQMNVGEVIEYEN